MKQKLDSSLKDLLENNVDENFYLSRDKINRIIRWKATQRPFQRILGKDSILPTLTARGAGEEHSGMILLSQELDSTTCMEIQNEDGSYRYDNSKGLSINIRKLTPLESWRAMGWEDKYFNSVKELGIPNRQLYQLAGNSIVVNVLEVIFEELCKAQNIQYLKND